MDGDVLLRFFMALVFTLSLIGLLYWLVRRYAPTRLLTPAGPGNRLQILEVRVLDARHRLVLVQRDSVEHLLLLGPQSDLVVEAGITAAAGGAVASGSFREQLERPAPETAEGTRP
jgi:flagellar protein FliO/FliZ